MILTFKKYVTLFLVFGCLLVGGFIFAGTITTASAPTPTMHTLNDIYNLIHNNQIVGEGSHTLSPGVTTNATSSYSISQIYADLANLIKKQDVAVGRAYLGIEGDYNNPNPSPEAVAIIASSLNPLISPSSFGYSLNDVYHLIVDSSKVAANSHSFTPSSSPSSSMHSLNDIYSALLVLISPENIKQGVEYLGQTGTYIRTWYFKADTNNSWSNLTNWWANSDGTGSHPLVNAPWTADDGYKADNLSLVVGQPKPNYPVIDVNIGVNNNTWSVTGTCDINALTNGATIYSGIFTGDHIDNVSIINGGTFTGIGFDNAWMAIINGGTFSGDGFINTNSGSDYSTINGGLFSGNNFLNYGTINGGTFSGSGFINYLGVDTAIINGGTFTANTRASVTGIVAPFPATRFVGE